MFSDEVANRWIAWNERFEGRVPYMYADIRGLITTGVGNLIDPMSLALSLPWTLEGEPATKQQIIDEWLNIKDHSQYLAKAGHLAAKKIAKLRLSDRAIDDLVMTRLRLNFQILKKKFTLIETWPWQAQMALLSMSWAMGPKFWLRWPALTNALLEQNWARAATECKIREAGKPPSEDGKPGEAGNPGVKPRNIADIELFKQAAGC